jgi:hypothetical protein
VQKNQVKTSLQREWLALIPLLPNMKLTSIAQMMLMPKQAEANNHHEKAFA